jgi:oligopeptide transport system substrate-binding protein
MLSKKPNIVSFTLLSIVVLIAAQCNVITSPQSFDAVSQTSATPANKTEAVVENEPVTLRRNIGMELPTLDPALATDLHSINHIRNLFISLTRFDPETADVIPYLATDWEVSDDGLEWTFHLRQDVPWVHYDPDTGGTVQIVDEAGNVRFVNAQDVVYGLKRTIDPATASDYAYVLYTIENAQKINIGALEPDALGVVALDE